MHPNLAGYNGLQGLPFFFFLFFFLFLIMFNDVAKKNKQKGPKQNVS